MKPIKLTIQAFGPFSDVQEIDFTKLGTNPLFLINGPTGSGKTSVLDAICFALYGETTGNERQGTQMRCDLAPLSLPTEVTLEFALHDKAYRITRSPEQEAPKARGDGTTVRKHTAALYQLGDEETLITSKTAQVKTEVTELLGLNETQFRQVMVLPQGKFRELLLASSKEREEIFGQLFQTDVYKRIEYALKDKASSISKAKNDFDNQIRGALQVAEVETEHLLDEQYGQLKQALEEVTSHEEVALAKLQAHKQAQQSATALHERFAQQDNATKALAQHLQSAENQNIRRHQLELALAANKLALPYAKWQQSCKHVDDNVAQQTTVQVHLEKHAVELELANKQLSVHAEQAALIPTLTDKLYTIETVKSKLIEKQQLDSESKTLVATQSQQQETLIKYQAFKQTLEAQSEQGKIELEKARSLYSEKPTIEAELQRLKRAIADVTKLEQLKLELNQQGALTLPLEQAVANALELLTLKQREADQLELGWHSAQAAVLAQKLAHDHPCPVCGSLEHPKPARFVGNEVSKQQVDVAREAERAAFNAHNNAVNKLDQHNGLVLQTQSRLEELSAELANLASVASSELVAEQQAHEAKLRDITAIDLEVLEKSVKELDQRSEKGEAKISELKEQMSASKAQQDVLIERITLLAKAIGDTYLDVDSTDKALSDTRNQIEKLNQAHEGAKQHVQKLSVEKSALDGQAKSLAEQHFKLVQTSQDDYDVWQDALNSSQFTNEADFLNGRATDEQVQSLQAEIESYQQTQIKLEQTVEDLKRQLSEQQKPDLDGLQQQLQELESQYKQARASLDQTHSHYERLAKVKRDIEILHDKNAQLESEYKVFGTLFDVASGKTGSRVSLHRFVLGVLLDDVLVQASQRLSLMSKGRYILMRKTDGFKGAAGRGLDLIVEDGYSGKTRDVATLSGGESFMAALSLALGLSDVVQSYSGGIRLDTLFIDEGFGSLDPESLDLAIQTLVDLQQTGRTIGLISHVSELKEQMSVRVDVLPTKVGSCIKLVVG